MKFLNKLKWVLGILMVFMLIITTNLIDRNNFLRVRDSVVTIYEDRLVAKDLIFEISKAIQDKEIAALTIDSTFYKERNAALNANIKDHITQYELTTLTKEERRVFDDFTKNLAALQNAETGFMQSDFGTKDKVVTQISRVKDNLAALSKIQLNEGRRQMSISKKAVDAVELFTQIEIYLLIFLAVVIQIIVIYNPKEK
ncbi:MAG: MCP four helix bundle domain-containing protein [Psychroserpens sp.]|uniref:MCP four helix bundle domain-containing protein n=1 Tax=Psychroserpens sp. TaxID=2020870 RepID=UPI003C707B6E